MKTPISVLLTAIVYWLIVYSTTMVPHLINDYHINLLWIVLVIPNVLRLIVGSIPRLAVDQVFFFSSSVIALVLTYVINMIWSDTKNTIREYGSNRRKTLELSALLMLMFTIGALITYFTGIDSSIYSNMGWETNQGFTM